MLLNFYDFPVAVRAMPNISAEFRQLLRLSVSLLADLITAYVKSLYVAS